MKTIPILFLTAACALGALSPATAAEQKITLSKPAQPAVLRAQLMNGHLTVIGADVNDVTVRSSGSSPAKDTTRDDGLRVIARSSALNVSEHDNTVQITQDPGSFFGGRGDIEVTVPRNTAVVVKIVVNGQALVRDISGDIEVSNLNGPVQLENVSGGVAVDTMNGEVTARYAALPAGKTHAFSSMNGKIALYVPSTGKATFRLRAQNGTVATDLDEKVFETRAEGNTPTHSLPAGPPHVDRDEQPGTSDDGAEESDSDESPATPEAAVRPPQPPAPPRVPHLPTFPAFGGQAVTGLLNGGGVEVRATTMNGEIQIRQAK